MLKVNLALTWYVIQVASSLRLLRSPHGVYYLGGQEPWKPSGVNYLLHSINSWKGY